MNTNSLSVADSQVELFRLFVVLFATLAGTPVEAVANIEEIRQRMLDRVKHDAADVALQFNTAAAELEDFYKKNVNTLFNHAKTLGGVKLVTGGQRAFGLSAFTAVRIAGLYADTQLIPDPVYPYFTGDMHLNAMHLQLAHALYYILQLKPLVDARLPIPPLFVFPSFEMELEDGDAVTTQGINSLALQLVAPVCDGTFVSIEELMEYALKHEDRFISAVMAEHLFIPPGGVPDECLSGSEACKRYLAALEGVRDTKLLAQMRKAPSGVLVLNGILERVGPQFHLCENAAELGAQPLLTQKVHWHYYEKCAQATAQSLVKKCVLTEQSYQTLRALQDDSLGWLANIPIDGLVELNRNQEHKFFRKELKEYTAMLTSAGVADLNQVIREVNHALADLVQRHQKAIRDIEARYAPKKWGVYISGALTVGAAATAMMLPSLTPALGLTAPVAAMVGCGIGYGKEKIGEFVEKRGAGKTMLGMLAIAQAKTNQK